jgi:ribosomal protein L29
LNEIAPPGQLCRYTARNILRALLVMNSIQYEELSRLYIARQLRVEPNDIRSVQVPNAQRPGLPSYKHQIDLYWETEDAVSRYLTIANAKWRGTSKVDQPDILLLQQVRQKVAAHKAIAITNSGFTSGAIAAAYDEGIGLHVVRPSFDASELSTNNRDRIQAQLAAIERGTGSIFRANVAYKSADLIFGLDQTTEELDPEAWLTSQLQLRLDYLRMLATQDYPVNTSEISELDREIARRRTMTTDNVDAV